MISLDEMLERIERAAERQMRWRRLATEVSRRQELYEELKKEKARAEAAANMSHEIRTPMTAILGDAESLLELGDLSQAPEQRLQALHAIQRSGVHLLSVINDILDISKIEAGGLTVERFHFDPLQIIGEAMALHREHAAAKGLPLSSEYRSEIPSSIEGDPARLKQILINLLSNAVKFTAIGSVRLEAGLVLSKDGPRLRFAVTDTGIGISEEQRLRLFLPFEQANQSTSRQYGGTGLGLAISGHLAQLMGGRIEVQSEPGCGSTFTVEIPTGSLDGVSMVSDPAAVEQSRAAVLALSRTARDLPRLDCRILVAEDSPDKGRVVCHLLQGVGAEVEMVENGRLAVDRALAARDEGLPFDLILMDMQMPVMDGYQATRTLRSQGYTLPIIALTAHALQEERQRCLECGCDDYQSKPIQREELIEAILRCLVSVKDDVGR